MTSIPSNNFQVPKRPYAVFISNKGSNSFADEKPINIPSCRACGNRMMEPLESEQVYICCGCGKRVPMSVFQSQPAATSTTKEGGGASGGGGIRVTGGVSTTQSQKKNIVFAQPKRVSLRK